MIALIVLQLVVVAVVLLLFIVYYKLTSGRFDIAKYDLTAKTYVVTGTTSGIGLATVEQLFARGGNVIMLCRDIKRANVIATRLRNEIRHDGHFVRVLQCELSSMDSVRRAAELINDDYEQIDCLINNAGMGATPGSNAHNVTADGIEVLMASNYFGHFLLTQLLLPALRRTARSRIVNVSSLMHQGLRLDDISAMDLKREQHTYDGFINYNYSKLAQIWHARHLSKLLYDEGICVLALNPGIVATPIVKSMLPKFLLPITQLAMGLVFKTAASGAQSSLYCAVSEEAYNLSGNYVSDCRPLLPTLTALNDEYARRAFKLTTDIVSKYV